MAAVLVMTGLSLLLGSLLAFAAWRLRPDEDTVVARIEELLPQTQCAQCGYPGCRPYAEAVARGEADINRCPPGGQATVDALAALLGVPSKPLDADRGPPPPAQVAFVREADCIGCALCIQACPVDAIVGARGHLHTVLAEVCTGCELCLPPCPVDCIELEPAPRRHLLPRRPDPALLAAAARRAARAQA
ncbi:MAG: electron transport complex subunit B [Lysobacteraceae bacterium]|nr:MAG: electron transport complex subunit B [Xanthomonadaceae bacterium]